MIVINKGDTEAEFAVYVSDVSCPDPNEYQLHLNNGTTRQGVTIPITKLNQGVIRFDYFEFDETQYNLDEGLYDYSIIHEERIVGRGKLLVRGENKQPTSYLETTQRKQYEP